MLATMPRNKLDLFLHFATATHLLAVANFIIEAYFRRELPWLVLFSEAQWRACLGLDVCGRVMAPLLCAALVTLACLTFYATTFENNHDKQKVLRSMVVLYGCALALAAHDLDMMRPAARWYRPHSPIILLLLTVVQVVGCLWLGMVPAEQAAGAAGPTAASSAKGRTKRA